MRAPIAIQNMPAKQVAFGKSFVPRQESRAKTVSKEVPCLVIEQNKFSDLCPDSESRETIVKALTYSGDSDGPESLQN